jgi:hypothetical protein
LFGVTAGYGAWLLAVTLIVGLTPVNSWTLAAVLALALVTVSAAFLARHQSDREKAVACWVAPGLPALTSVYLLVGPLLLAVGVSA